MNSKNQDFRLTDRDEALKTGTVLAKTGRMVSLAMNEEMLYFEEQSLGNFKRFVLSKQKICNTFVKVIYSFISCKKFSFSH